MSKILIVLYFDCEEKKEDEERDIYRFILNCEEDNFKEKLYQVFKKNNLLWGNYESGYKTIFSMNQTDITNLPEY